MRSLWQLSIVEVAVVVVVAAAAATICGHTVIHCYLARLILWPQSVANRILVFICNKIRFPIATRLPSCYPFDCARPPGVAPLALSTFVATLLAVHLVATS